MLLRISLGWLFFYSGITKVFDPSWSVQSYIEGAKSFTFFYQWLAGSDILPLVDILNKWGQTFLGLSLIFGLFVRLASYLGIVLMLLYYLVILDFPYPNKNSFLVDQHVIYSIALLILSAFQAGRYFGFDGMVQGKSSRKGR